MSTVRITVGTATVDLDSVLDRQTAGGVHPCYDPRDLMDATASALLAVNTPQAVEWAQAISALTTDLPFPPTNLAVPPPL